MGSMALLLGVISAARVRSISSFMVHLQEDDKDGIFSIAEVRRNWVLGSNRPFIFLLLVMGKPGEASAWLPRRGGGRELGVRNCELRLAICERERRQ